MNLLKPIALASLVVFAGAASAQASKFQGGFGQIGVGYESVDPSHASSTLTVNGRSIPVTTSANNANSVIGTVGLGWYQDVAKGFLLGIGAEYSPFAGSNGSMSVSTTTRLPGQQAATNDYTYQMKNSYNIFLSPAMTVGADGLAYAKVGYTGAQVATYNSQTSSFTGYSLGLGYKQIFNAGWYAFIEANYANYGNQTVYVNDPPGGPAISASGTNGLTSMNALVGVGYKF